MSDKETDSAAKDSRPSPEDDLLQELGRIARQEVAEEKHRFGDRFRRLSDGTLSQEEHDALLKEVEESEQRRLDYEAFRPLEDSFKLRALEALKQQSRKERDPAQEAGRFEVGASDSEEIAPDNTAPIEITPFIRHRRSPQPWLALAAVLSMAALGLWLFRGVSSKSADLPLYTFEISGERSTLRSPESTPRQRIPEFTLGDRFRLVLRPEERIPEGTQSQIYLADAGGGLRPWALQAPILRRSGDGSIRIEGKLGQEIDIEPGSYTLIFLYGSATVPEPTTLQELDVLETSEAWRVVRVPFKIALPPLTEGEIPLEVLYAGCFDVIAGPSCVPLESLTVWARSEPAATIKIFVNDQRLELDGEAVDGGQRFTVPIEIKAEDRDLISRRLEIRADLDGKRSSYRLAFSRFEELEWLRKALRLAMAGHLKQAKQTLLTHLEIDPSGQALSLLARLPGAPKQDRIEWLEQAIVEHRQAGRLLAMAEDFGMLASFDLADRRFAALRRRVHALSAYESQLPGEGIFHLHYYRGILENDLGAARDALAALEKAASTARRLDLPLKLSRAVGEKALLLQRLGRGAEAARIFASFEADSIPEPCERALWQNNHAWSLILARSEASQPKVLLERALKLIEENACGDAELLNVQLNRAIAFLIEDELFEAQQALLAVDALSDASNALHELWRQDAEGQILLASGRHQEALSTYQRLESLAELAFEPRARWRAKIQQATALEALGDLEAALAALAEAEQIVEAEGLEVPLGAGRGNFLADRESGTRRRLDLLLRSGRSSDAFEVARRSRVRPFQALRQGHRLADLSPSEQALWDLQIGRYLEQRAKIEEAAAEDWQLTQSGTRNADGRRTEQYSEALRALDEAFRVFELEPMDLPVLASGEGVLLFHPLERDWVGFAADSEGLMSHRFDLDDGEIVDPGQLAQRLLEPFRRVIEHNERLRILPHAELREIDFHALPWDDGVLLEALPVVYGLDLVPLEVDHQGARIAEAALVISDARGDLSASRLEANGVEVALTKGLGRDAVTRLEGSRATLPELLLRLPGVTLLHIAGHSESAGAFGWQSAILLAEQGRLSVGDILSIQAPEEVVLSSCESARDAGASGVGLGLAQAFLIAGSKRVVASTRPVGDVASAELFRRFYDGKGTIAERLRHAQLAWRKAEPGADWASFRLLAL